MRWGSSQRSGSACRMRTAVVPSWSMSCSISSVVAYAALVSGDGRRGGSAYHSLVRKGLDLLDSAGGPLLEGDTVQLFQNRPVSIRLQQ